MQAFLQAFTGSRSYLRLMGHVVLASAVTLVIFEAALRLLFPCARGPTHSRWVTFVLRCRGGSLEAVDIMARRGGRGFRTAVTGQLLSEGVQQPEISNSCLLIGPKEEKAVLEWT